VDQSPSTPVSARSPEGRLDSWKEIAAYLNRDVTTVQRWEKREGMPVHRHVHDRIGSVYAFRAELDEWTRSRNLRVEPSGNPGSPISAVPPQASRSSKSLRLGLLIAAILLAVFGLSFWLYRTEYFWHSPLVDARFQTLTDFGGVEQAAAISRDGHFVAFLSDHDGPMDVWLTQVGTNQFHNLTHGSAPELVNAAVRTLGFSADGSLVTYWVRKKSDSDAGEISIWSVPTLGGQASPYLEGVAEYDWSRDGSQLVYHTPGPGDPLFISQGKRARDARHIFTAPAGLHSHFPLWAPDSKFIYFVQGSPPDKLDIYRIPSGGGIPERITSHNSHVSHPVFLGGRTLLYLASDPDGSGPFLYSIDLDRRIPHRLSSAPDLYTSLAASADGQRLVVTVANPKRTLWRLPLADSSATASEATLISLSTSTGFSPRLGPGYVLYVSSNGASESIWKLASGNSTELWRGEGARILGEPAISPDGRLLAFSVRERGQRRLYVMHADGTSVRIINDSLELEGNLAWSPDGKSITSAADAHGTPHLFRVPVDGGGSPTAIVNEYSIDPAWSPDGSFVLYSGPDIGTTFVLKAVTPQGTAHSLPVLTLTRGARHITFLPGGSAFVFLRGDLEHKNLWQMDLKTGTQRQLTNLPADFHIQNFDLSPDGRELVLERVQERSEIVLLDIPHH
jgi:Tol biopolymer transport system component